MILSMWISILHCQNLVFTTMFCQGRQTHLFSLLDILGMVGNGKLSELDPQHSIDSSFLLTYSLTPWSRVLLEKLTGSQLVKKFPAFYGIQRFIITFTRARHLSVLLAAYTYQVLKIKKKKLIL